MLCVCKVVTPLGKYLGTQLLKHIVGLHLALEESANLFPRWKIISHYFMDGECEFLPLRILVGIGTVNFALSILFCFILAMLIGMLWQLVIVIFTSLKLFSYACLPYISSLA